MYTVSGSDCCLWSFSVNVPALKLECPACSSLVPVLHSRCHKPLQLQYIQASLYSGPRPVCLHFDWSGPPSPPRPRRRDSCAFPVPLWSTRWFVFTIRPCTPYALFIQSPTFSPPTRASYFHVSCLDAHQHASVSTRSKQFEGPPQAPLQRNQRSVWRENHGPSVCMCGFLFSCNTKRQNKGTTC